MPGVATPPAILTNLVRVAVCLVLTFSSSSSATATDATKSEPVHRVARAATTRRDAFRYTPPVAGGTVDVFLDLAGPDSAAAWPTIRQVVWEYGFRTEFVFHILPAPRNEVAFYAAKAAQVVRMSSSGSDEAFLFIDVMLDHQNTSIVLNGASGDDMTQLEMLDMLVSEAVAGSGITENQFQRGMADPRVDRLVRNQIEAAASLSVYATPTVLLNGIFMMHLVGPETLQSFELFVGRGMSPKPIVSETPGGDTWRASAESSGPIGEEGGTDEDGHHHFGTSAASRSKRAVKSGGLRQGNRMSAV